jgi:hypothetical protein
VGAESKENLIGRLLYGGIKQIGYLTNIPTDGEIRTRLNTQQHKDALSAPPPHLSSTTNGSWKFSKRNVFCNPNYSNVGGFNPNLPHVIRGKTSQF